MKKPWWFRDSVWCEEEEGKGGFDWVVDPVLITKVDWAGWCMGLGSGLVYFFVWLFMK